MGLSAAIVVTLLGMTAVTYGARIAGVLLMSRVELSVRTRAWLESIPGAVLVAIIAPTVLSRGPAELIAAGITALVALWSRNMLLSAAAGVFAVWALRLTL